jgi:hypothetical protein
MNHAAKVLAVRIGNFHLPKKGGRIIAWPPWSLPTLCPWFWSKGITYKLLTCRMVLNHCSIHLWWTWDCFRKGNKGTNGYPGFQGISSNRFFVPMLDTHQLVP